MIDAKKLSNWYDFQAPLYRLWRDDYDGPLVQVVRELLGPVLPAAKPLKLLDASCGTGMFALGLAKRDPELRHRLGFKLGRRSDNAPAILLALYEHGSCSDCREWVVRSLLKLGALPEAYRLECADDANDYTQRLVK